MKIIYGRAGRAFITLALFLLVPALSTARAVAQDGPPPQEDGRPNPEGDLVRQLNLTPDQIDKIRAIREQNRDERRMVGQRVRAARMALDRAIYVENAEQAVVEERARELADAMAANVRLQAVTELSIRRILTPEQLQTLRALRLRAENERRERRQRDNANRRSEQDGDLPPLGDRFRRRQNQPNRGDGGPLQEVSPRGRRARP